MMAIESVKIRISAVLIFEIKEYKQKSKNYNSMSYKRFYEDPVRYNKNE